MTKSELKSIIMECLEEEGVVTEAFDEDDAVIESCQMIEEACFALLENSDGEGVADREFDRIVANAQAGVNEIKNNEEKMGEAIGKSLPAVITPDVKEEAKKKSIKEVLKKLGKDFAAEGDKVIYTGKKGGELKKKHVAIAAAATALAGTIAAIAVKKAKSSKKEDNKEEENKEDK